MNTVKNKLNVVGRTYVKQNSTGGEILSFIPDVPISGYLDDFLFILTVPSDDQKFAPAYLRLQDKTYTNEKREEVKEFTEVKSVGYFKQKRGDIIVCAPKTHVFVDFSKIVFIATIPPLDKTSAPCYIKKKVYNRSKAELNPVEIVYQDINDDHIEKIMKEIDEDSDALFWNCACGHKVTGQPYNPPFNCIQNGCNCK